MSGRLSRRSVLRTAGALSGIGVLGTPAAAAEDPSTFIVGTSSPAADRAARSRADSVHRELEFGAIGRAVAGRFSPNAREALRKRPGVRYVEPDSTVEPLGQILPWGIDHVDAEGAHANGDAGNGADIAIIDSGIDADHPDLQANLGEGYAVEPCSGCREPWGDDHGHGTHCAGIAGAVDNEEGVVGVSTEATLHAVKVYTSESNATVSGLAEGVRWVAEQGYDVGSMSLGAASSHVTLRDACRYAYEKGVFLVAAAGNEGPCDDCVRYPAAYETVVAVSAITNSNSLASFSSAGPEVELAAPGAYIYSTVPGGYGSESGTSMAGPHVAGAAGQLMANGFSNVEARARLQETANDIGLTDDQQGYGLLDVAAAVGDSGSVASPTVTTGAATDVGETAATLHGSLDDLGGADTVEVSFEWGERGTGLSNGTTWLTQSSTGGFTASIHELSTGTEYTFRAVARTADGDTASGTEQTFTTERWSGDAPSIDHYAVRERGSPNPHTEIAAVWAVSDANGDLDSVVVEIVDAGGTVLESSHRTVDGSSAIGADRFRLKHTGSTTFDIRLTVTDDVGNSTSQTATVSS